MTRHGWGPWSGAGLVAANMIGASVFVSAGFMAQQMGPGPILASWVLGGALALCGVIAYGALASRIPQSGGEYRYLSDLLHPALGYLAGWGSRTLGFAAPVALDAFAAGAFLDTVLPIGDPRWFGSVLIVGLTIAHAQHAKVSRLAQNGLVALKLLLVVGFVAVGIGVGRWSWPTWSPPASAGLTWTAFFENQLWIAFAFSGWNAAVYAAGEFRNPRRDVRRAMLVGSFGVWILYLLVNGVFVANLTPAEANVVTESHVVTLGHVVAARLLGPVAAAIVSLGAVFTFTSAMSAMTIVGPRVYAGMARDGFLPAALAGRDGEPPVGSVVLQGVFALGLLWSTSLHGLVEQAAAILLLFTGLTTLTVFRLGAALPDEPGPSAIERAAAGTYTLAASGFLYLAFRDNPSLLALLGGVGAIGVVAWMLSARRALALR
jgi:APA family basic amino acid/polyamine antiporter